MQRSARASLLLALLLLAAQGWLAAHRVQHWHADTQKVTAEACQWCAGAGPALPAQASPPAVPRQASGIAVLSHWAEPPAARPSQPPPVRGPPVFS